MPGDMTYTVSEPYRGTFTVSNGWTCWNCSTWVPNGVTHSCPTTVRVLPQVTFGPPKPVELTEADIERIAKRVAELLAERLADK